MHLQRPSIFVPLLAMLLASSPLFAHAQTHDQDAARLLREAYERYEEMIRDFDRDHPFWYLEYAPWKLDPQVAAREHARMQPVLEPVRKMMELGPDALRLSPSDLSMTSSFATALKVARNDLLYRIHLSNEDIPTSEFTQFVRMTTALRNEPSILHSVVEIACTALTTRTLAQDVIGTGQLSAADARAIGAALDESLAGDAFGFAAAFAGEREQKVAQMRELLNSGDRAELEDLLATDWRANTLPATALSLQNLSDDELRTAITLYDGALTRATAIAAMNDPDLAAREYDRFLDELRRGGYGPVALLAIGDRNYMEIAKDALEFFHSLRAELREIERLQAGALDSRNAAIWYRKAMAAQSRLLDDEEMALIRRAVGLDEKAAPDPLFGMEADAVPPMIDGVQIQKLLTKSQPVFEILFDAAGIERCEWDRDRDHYGFRSSSRPDYLDGMRDLLALHLVALAHAEEPRDHARAGQHLTSAIIMFDHLAQDHMFETSRFTRALFAEASPALSSVNLTSHELCDGITAALARIDPKDPFGFRRAVAEWPDYMTRPLVQWYADRYSVTDLLQTIRWLPRRMEVIGVDVGSLEQEMALLTARDVNPTLHALHALTTDAAARAAECQLHADVDALETLLLEQRAEDQQLTIIATWTTFLTDAIVRGTRAAIDSVAEYEDAIAPLRAKEQLP